MLGETLKKGADNHDDRAGHNAGSSSVFLVEPWGYRDREDRTKLVAGRDETKHASFNIVLLGVLLAHVAISEVCTGLVSKRSPV